MTTEEKAKAYDEALSKARKKVANVDRNDKVYYIEDIEDLFPELIESGDEKIRKELIELVKETHTSKRYYDLNKMIAWLEKQSEQKPVDIESIKTEFYDAGYEDGKEFMQKPVEWSEKDEEHIQSIEHTIRCMKAENIDRPDVQYAYVSDLNWLKSLKDRIQPQPKPVDWSDEDKQYLLVCKNALAKYQVSDKWDAGIISRWLENRLKLISSQQKQEWSEKDKKRIEQICEDLQCGMENRNAHKTVRALHYDEIILSNISWLKSLYPYPKQEWSKEDEDYYDAIIAKLEVTQDDALLTDNQMIFLKSLRPQSHWKPSEEQMEYLLTIKTLSPSPLLESLYIDLKKLREE